MYVKKIETYHTIWLHFSFFIFNPGYEYADFQFSQNDGYAQGLYISIFSFYSYKKSRINMCVMCAY
jgi:hypothetical protein